MADQIAKKLKTTTKLISISMLGAALLLVTLPALSLRVAFAASSTGSNTSSSGNNTTAPQCSGSTTFVPDQPGQGTNTNPSVGPTNSGRCIGAPVGQASDKAATCNNCAAQVYQYVNAFVDLLSAVAALVATISIVIGGIQYTSSSDDPQKVSKAKKRITDAITAIIAFLLLWAFLQWLIPGGYFNGAA